MYNSAIWDGIMLWKVNISVLTLLDLSSPSPSSSPKSPLSALTPFQLRVVMASTSGIDRPSRLLTVAPIHQELPPGCSRSYLYWWLSEWVSFESSGTPFIDSTFFR